MRMVSAVVLGVVCGVTSVIVAVVIIIICRLYKKRQHHTCIPPSGYDAVGDYKPPSLMSISSGSQEVQITKEHRTVQPRSNSTVSRTSISTMSRGSVKSDPFTEDTSSISAKSDTSVDSFIFDPSFGAIRPDLYPRKDAVLQQSSLDQNHGRLHIRIKYDYRTSDVVVHLIEAQELSATEVKDDGGFGDPYVRISMVPEVDERIRQSSVKRRSCNPFFNEYFKFPVTFDDVKDKMITFQIFDYDKFSRHKVIGEVQIDLGKVDVSNSVEMWCDILKYQKFWCEIDTSHLKGHRSCSYLTNGYRQGNLPPKIGQRQHRRFMHFFSESTIQEYTGLKINRSFIRASKCQQEVARDFGDILLSLSYLPTAERLTIVVMKAKDLMVCSESGTSDPYVRVSLIVEGKKIKRKKTSVKRGTTAPIWNEALSFNVPADLLSKVSLEVSVLDHDLIGHGDMVGRCILGPERDGMEGKHWNDMMQNHRKSLAMWQNLHR